MQKSIPVRGILLTILLIFAFCVQASAGVNLVLFGDLSYETSYSGKLKLLGRVQNTGDLGANLIEIHFTLYDAGGRVVDTASSYINGTCVNLDFSGGPIPAEAALLPGDVGFFEVYTDVKPLSVTSIDVGFSYQTYAMIPMEAQLVLDGPVNPRQDYFGDLDLLGNVKNTGSKGLILGQVFFAVTDAAGYIIDTAGGYIKGDHVFLPDSNTYTDTALDINSVGVYEVWTDADFSRYHSLEFRGYWWDAVIEDGVVTRAEVVDLVKAYFSALAAIDPSNPDADLRSHAARNAYIGRLKALLKN